MKLTEEQRDGAAAALRSLLKTRKKALAAGPRNLRELAGLLGVAPPTLQAYVNGKRNLLMGGEGAVTLGKIAQAMGVNPSELLP